MPRDLDLNLKAELLRGFFSAHHRLPSYSEMQALFGYRSKNAAYYVVGRLVESGYLRRGPAGRLVPLEKLVGPVRVLGAVSDGLPEEEQPGGARRRSLDTWLAGEGAPLMLTVVDDRLWEKGVLPGDRVLIDPEARPRVGDLVLVHERGEWQLCVHSASRGRRRAGRASASDSLPRRVSGVVQAVVRKLR